MKTDPNQSRIKEGTSAKELLEMQTEMALIDSMAQSKTLVVMVIIGIILFGGFFLFLYKMAG